MQSQPSSQPPQNTNHLSLPPNCLYLRHLQVQLHQLLHLDLQAWQARLGLGRLEGLLNQ